MDAGSTRWYTKENCKICVRQNLQKLATPVDAVPANSAAVLDGMSLVHKVSNNVKTFGEIATSIHAMICKEGSDGNRIDVVFDRYDELSIKTSERSTRGEEQGLQLQNIAATQIVRQWRSFLKKVNNKSSLIQFLVEEWNKPMYTSKLQGKTLFVTHMHSCWQITDDCCKEVDALQCTHEEADGRLLLHAEHAAKAGYSAIVICSEDTDVFVLCLTFSKRIGVPVFMKCGTQNRTRLVDIHRISAAIGSDVCGALIGMHHAFTGCYSVSALQGKGSCLLLRS